MWSLRGGLPRRCGRARKKVGDLTKNGGRGIPRPCIGLGALIMLDEKNLRRDEINDDLFLYQIKNGLLFGTDALKLADFICENHMGTYKTAIEFGTGSGAISLLLARRGKTGRIYAVEIQEVYAQLAEHNVCANGLCERIKIICADLKDCDNLYCDQKRIVPHSADMVFANPPYIKYTKDGGKSGMLSELDHKNISRREIECNICDVAMSAARLLKNGGDFYVVYRPDRLLSLIAAMAEHNITPKKMAFVHANPNGEASLVLVKGKQGASEGLKVENIYI